MLLNLLKTPLAAGCLALAGAFLTPTFGITVSAIAEGTSDTSVFDRLSNNLRPRMVIGTDMPRYSLEERMAFYGVPGVAIGIVKDGKLVHAQGFGVLQVGKNQKVDSDTLFSAGSVSKIATAALVLKMHAEQRLDINKNVEDYLTSWQLPKDEVAKGADVSLRMILSHTAGFNIHGFGDFLPGENLPSVYETLNGKSPAKHDSLKFLFTPGTGYKYSGGGYTLVQVITMDISGQDFPQTTQSGLFSPLKMTRSSFVNPLPETVTNVAKAHNHKGQAVALPRGYEAMPEMAASGLWTSANDLGRLVAALIRSYRTDQGFLPQKVAADMMTKVSPSEHGLGPRLEGRAAGRFFHHGGANDSYRTWIEGHLATGDGLVVLTNGARGNDLAIEIRNAAADTFGWEINKPIRISPVPVSEDVLASYVGQYQPDESFPVAHREQMIGRVFDSPFNVTLKDGKLLFSRPGSTSILELVPTAPNRFLIAGFKQRVGIAELVFHRDGLSKTNSLTLEFSGARSFYNRFPATTE